MKVLIIRLSSFGDIVQCMSILGPLRSGRQDIDIDWVSRSDFAPIVKLSPFVNKVWSFDRKLGLLGLFKFAFRLRKMQYTHIYDAHSTIRSRILSLILCPFPWSITSFKRRSKERIKRICLFKFKIDMFEKPFLGMKSYLDPINIWFNGYEKENLIQNWDFPNTITNELVSSHYIVLAPSAAWPMKTWPKSHFTSLISLLPQFQFVILGGPEDEFCQKFEDQCPHNVKNMAGKLSLVESCLMIKNASMVVSADTGLIHVADILGINGVSLLGPTAFGRCTGNHIKTFEIDLDCRPCTKDGRGKCTQKVFQKCMIDIKPENIAEYIKEKVIYE